MVSGNGAVKILSLVSEAYPDWRGLEDPRFVKDEIINMRKACSEARESLGPDELRSLMDEEGYEKIRSRLGKLTNATNLFYRNQWEYGRSQTMFKKISTLFMAFFVCLFVFAPAETAQAKLVKIFNRAIAIDEHLEGHERDPIEGIWVWREAVMGNQIFEVAIVPNTFKYKRYRKFDFVGIVSDGSGFVKEGETKLLLTRTGERTYEGQLVVIFKDGMSKSVQTPEISIEMGKDDGALSFSVPAIGLFGHESEVRAEKIWPEDSGLKGDKPGTGTAFFVGKDVLVTNAHVVEGFEECEIAYRKEAYPARVLVRDEVNDIALLKVKFSDFKTLQSVKPMSLGDVHSVFPGETIFSIGYPMIRDLGVNPKIGMGIVNGTTGPKDDPRMFQISVPLQPGNSGGPLINEYGNVIGITSSGMNVAYYMQMEGFTPQNVNFAIKADYIGNLIAVTEGCSQMRPGFQERKLSAKDIMMNWQDSVVLVICR